MTDRTQRFCLVLHAERLHEDQVWAATRRTLTGVRRRGGRMTLFVSPFWALVHGQSIAARLGYIASQGHEIAQHTHFYDWDGQRPDRYRKRTDLSDDNVLRCLTRDHRLLVDAGFRPQGFVSGAWERRAVVARWLAETGFVYDCSVRSYLPNPMEPDDALAPGVTSVPTTHSLRRAIADMTDGRLDAATVGCLRYSLCYSHDYDLTAPGRRIAAAVLARWAQRLGGATTVGEVVGSALS